ncbi:MAG: Trk system potassium transporter TrkA, partial [Muribaculaceae bacterium]|nr:Trk system potassium transporter TrkA [Muribaculaceae bacterium]
MKIVIAGAGDVGSHLAKLLSNEEQDILVIDEDQNKIMPLDANYNLMTMAGNPASFKTLRDARAGDCDLFIAVTPYETENVTACAISKRLGAKRTVGRIDSYDYMDPANSRIIKEMGIDSLIYPEYVAAQEIISALERSWVRNWFELHDGEIIVVGVKLRANAPLAGMQLKEFASTQHNFHVSAIKRSHEVIIPRGDDRMMVGDILYFTTTREYVNDLIHLCGKTWYKIRRVMIMGGGKIAIRLAKMASEKFKIKILDTEMKVCRHLIEQCPNVEVVHADARDMEELVDNGIDDIDAFIALSDSSEANVLACLTAKDLGVKK